MAKKSRRTKRAPLSRKTKKNILQASILIVGVLVLVIGTLAVTGVFSGRKILMPLAEVTTSPAISSEPTTKASTEAIAQSATATTAAATATAAIPAEPTVSAVAEAVAEAAPTPTTEENYIAPPKELKPTKPVGDTLSLTEALTDNSLPSDAAEVIPSEEPTESIAEVIPSEEPTESIADDGVAATGTWMEMAIEANRDKIDDKDLDDFYAIIGKLNQSDIYTWANEGFTGEEQKLLIAHMHSRLSDVEYERAKSLFSTYRFILDTM